MRITSDIVHRMDFFRRSPFPYNGLGGHKEWLHFCIHAPKIAALVNFSLVDERVHEAGQPPWEEVPRLTVLVHDGRQWDGDVERFELDKAHVPGGRVEAHYGPNHLTFEDGHYCIQVELRDRPIRMDLRLKPLAVPGRAPNLRREDGPPIHWVVVPRLAASGTIEVDGECHTFKDAPAYHDHNWGFWSWGDDFAWEWGFGLDDGLKNPWHMVYVRLTNRARTRILAQALSVWKEGRQRKTFSSQDVEIFHEGLLRTTKITKIPRVMALISPHQPTDVPHFQNIVGRTERDEVICRFEGEDVSQVILPNDRDLGVTIINEVSGHLTMRGHIGGEQIDMAGRAIFEFLGS